MPFSGKVYYSKRRCLNQKNHSFLLRSWQRHSYLWSKPGTNRAVLQSFWLSKTQRSSFGNPEKMDEKHSRTGWHGETNEKHSDTSTKDFHATFGPILSTVSCSNDDEAAYWISEFHVSDNDPVCIYANAETARTHWFPGTHETSQKISGDSQLSICVFLITFFNMNPNNFFDVITKFLIKNGNEVNSLIPVDNPVYHLAAMSCFWNTLVPCLSLRDLLTLSLCASSISCFFSWYSWHSLTRGPRLTFKIKEISRRRTRKQRQMTDLTARMSILFLRVGCIRILDWKSRKKQTSTKSQVIRCKVTQESSHCRTPGTIAWKISWWRLLAGIPIPESVFGRCWSGSLYFSGKLLSDWLHSFLFFSISEETWTLRFPHGECLTSMDASTTEFRTQPPSSDTLTIQSTCSIWRRRTLWSWWVTRQCRQTEVGSKSSNLLSVTNPSGAHPTLPMGKFGKQYMPMACKPPLCNPYHMNFGLGVRTFDFTLKWSLSLFRSNTNGEVPTEWKETSMLLCRFRKELHTDSRSLETCTTVSRSFPQFVPLCGSDRDNMTIHYGQNLSPIDPFASLFDYQKTRDPALREAIPRRWPRSIQEPRMPSQRHINPVSRDQALFPPMDMYGIPYQMAIMPMMNTVRFHSRNS